MNATLNEYLDASKETESMVEEIKENLFVDDLTSGADTEDEAKELKETAVKIFSGGGFIMHKWHSNIPSLEDHPVKIDNDDNLSYAKEQLGTTNSETKILGVTWNKEEDKIGVSFLQARTRKHKTRNAQIFSICLRSSWYSITTTFVGKAFVSRSL